MVFTTFLLGAQYKRDSVKNKPECLLVVSLGKVLNGMPPSLCWRSQVVHPSWWPILTEDLQTEHELLRSVCTSSCVIFSRIAQTMTTSATKGTVGKDARAACVKRKRKRAISSDHQIVRQEKVKMSESCTLTRKRRITGGALEEGGGLHSERRQAPRTRKGRQRESP